MNTPRRRFEQYAAKLGRQIKGRLSEREGMKYHTSFRIGGLAEVMVWPRDLSEFSATVALAREMELPWRVIGLGSNLLVGDGGVEEVLISLGEGFQEIESNREVEGARTGDTEVPVRPVTSDDPPWIKLAAGVKLAKAVKYCQLRGMAGLEFAAGIPGGVGGAAVMNAGSLGSSMAAVLSWLEWWRPSTGPVRLTGQDLDYQYRRLARPSDAVVLACGLQLSPDEPRAIRERIVKGLKWRRQHQPLAHPSAGSVFKNPPGDYAGRLIEAVGLKGERMGDAQISDLHANFIVNRGRARSREVMALIERARKEVRKAFGIELTLELEVIGKELS